MKTIKQNVTFETSHGGKNGLSEEVHLSWLSNYDKGQPYEDTREKRIRAEDFGLFEERRKPIMTTAWWCGGSKTVEKVGSSQIIKKQEKCLDLISCVRGGH